MVRAIVRQAATHGNTFEAIIKGVVESPAFRMREINPVAPTQQAALTDSADTTARNTLRGPDSMTGPDSRR
jgi:hypothetical protein